MNKLLAPLVLLLLVVLLAPVAPPTKAATAPELPRTYLDTSYPSLSSGRTIRSVKTSCAGAASPCYTSLQTAIDQANQGDEIVMDAGMTAVGPIVLKNKATGSGWIVIRTSNMAGIPPAGTRVNPSHASAMPKIVAPGFNEEALRAEDRAHNYRLVGIEVTEQTPNDDSNVLIQLGWGYSYCGTSTNPYVVCTDQSVLDNYSNNIVLDRMYIHGHPTHNVKRGIGLDNKSSAVIDSYISDIHVVGQDAQAIAGAWGPGPYKIVNNYLEGAGENIIFGGDDPRVQYLIPSDIEFRGNHLYKPLRWRPGDPSYDGKNWSVKNLFELKNAQRVLVEGNVMENNWSHSQAGTAVLLTTVNQERRCSWCAVMDVTFKNNIVRHSGAGLGVLANDYTTPASTGRAQRIKIHNNLFDDLDGYKWRNLISGTHANNYLFSVHAGAREPGPDDVEFSNNTGFHTGTLLVIDGHSDGAGGFFPMARFNFTNNIAAHNHYGFFGSGTSGFDGPSLTAYFPGGVITKNIIMGQRASDDLRDWSGNFTAYPGNYFPKTWDAVGFANFAGGDYKLSAASIYRNLGTDGRDLGVDMNALNLATAGVVQGTGTYVPPVTPTPPSAPTPDTTDPVISIFAISPTTMQAGTTLTANFSVTDGGGSYLNSGELWRGTYNASTCNGSVMSGCAWTLRQQKTAPANSTSWQGSFTDTPTEGIYYYGMHVGDKGGNTGSEPALVKVTVANTQSPPPPSGDDVVIYASEITSIQGDWQKIDDTTAANGKRIWIPNKDVPKLAGASPTPANYFETTFTAEADKPYHVWMRFKAEADYWSNDSVFAQFSDSKNPSGNADYRIGTSQALILFGEDGDNNGLQNWGWNDNNYGALGEPITFASNGEHTLRIQQREDGISIDQIVLSPARYFTSAPGAAYGDSTIVNRPITPTLPTAPTPPAPGTRSPFSGTAFPVPATNLIQMEDFDNGGEGLGHHDSDTGNNGGVYRSSDVDIRAVRGTTGNHAVFNAFPGEWLTYSINVTTPGTYTLGAYGASEKSGGTFHIEVDGVDKTGPLTVPDTFGWYTYQLSSKSGIPLTAGNHILKVSFDAKGFYGVTGDFDALHIRLDNPGLPAPNNPGNTGGGNSSGGSGTGSSGGNSSGGSGSVLTPSGGTSGRVISRSEVVGRLMVVQLQVLNLVPLVSNPVSFSSLLQQIMADIIVLQADIAELKRQEAGGGSAGALFTQTLYRGMSHSEVSLLQERLRSEGIYSGPITGGFFSLTETAVKAYQLKYGITPTGTVGPLTRAKLNGL